MGATVDNEDEEDRLEKLDEYSTFASLYFSDADVVLDWGSVARVNGSIGEVL